MRLADLERESGVAITTIKYYLREGLLPKGKTITATRSEYSESHVTRLRLIRALVDGAGLSIAQVREVIQTLENPPSQGSALATAHAVVTPEFETTGEHSLVAQLVEKRGWAAVGGRPRAMLSRALTTMEAAGLEPALETVDAYAAAMESVAEVDLGLLGAAEDDSDAQLTMLIAGTITTDSLLLALRRIAQANLSTADYPQPEAE